MLGMKVEGNPDCPEVSVHKRRVVQGQRDCVCLTLLEGIIWSFLKLCSVK